jgi:uncharacterized protein (TIGR02145 family)
MKIKRIITLTALVFAFSNSIFSQVGIGTTTPNASAILDLTTTTQGFLPPRMTHVQKNNIATPAAGLMIWCTNCGSAGELQVYNGTTWTNMVGGTASKGCSANVGGTTKTFMCYNLGVTGTQDPFTYQGGNNNGALYQWGRQTDGHQVRTSLTQAGPVAAAVANRFITSAGSDWINPQNNSLWLDGSKTANDPCPEGFRVPTLAQWASLISDNGANNVAPNTATYNTWTWTGNGFTVGSDLYLPAAGGRNPADATVDGVGTQGFYWSSKVNGSSAHYLAFTSGQLAPYDNYFRGLGFSVRCISE